MPIDSDADIEITAFAWVPDMARGLVRDLRPRWACEEIGTAYRERLISAMDRPGWYFGEQPWGQVPHLRDGDVQVFESGAILLHLGERFEPLLPRGGAARAAVLSWTMAALNSVEPLLMELGNVDFFARGEQWATLRRPSLIAALDNRLQRLAEAFGDSEWIAGDFSIADIAMVTVLRQADGQSEADGGTILERTPVLANYVRRGTARPAFQTALADQLAAFDRNPPAERQAQGEAA